MYDFIGIYQEMICIGVLGVVGITTLVQRIINNCYIKPMPLPLH